MKYPVKLPLRVVTISLIVATIAYFLMPLLPVVFFLWLRRYVQPADPEPYQRTYPGGAQDVPCPAEDEWIDRVEKWITK